MGCRPVGDARAPSVDPHRVARHRSRVRRRCRARSDRRLRVAGRGCRRARSRPSCAPRSRLGTTSRPRPPMPLPTATNSGSRCRVPPALFLGPLPIARLLVAAGVVAPVLLLADGEIVLGLASLLVGAALVTVLSRSLVSLSRRWAVLVPAGFVVVDPLTLADPVLFLREHVQHLAPEPPAAVPDGVLDLRLGAGAGSVSARFDEAIELTRASRGRHGGTTVTTDEIRVAVVRREEMLRLCGRAPPARAGPRQVAIPPPTRASASYNATTCPGATRAAPSRTARSSRRTSTGSAFRARAPAPRRDAEADRRRRSYRAARPCHATTRCDHRR